MNGIYFTYKPMEENEENITKSKFLGSPVFPLDFLETHSITDNLYFMAQINLEDIKDKQSVLPDCGFLYFFLDVDTLEPTVWFTKDEPAVVMDDINDIFEGEYGATVPYELCFDPELTEGHYLLGDVNPDLGLEGDIDTDGKITLLEIDALALPDDPCIFDFDSLANGIGRYVFLIPEEDLARRDFSRVECIDCGS